MSALWGLKPLSFNVIIHMFKWSETPDSSLTASVVIFSTRAESVWLKCKTLPFVWLWEQLHLLRSLLMMLLSITWKLSPHPYRAELSGDWGEPHHESEKISLIVLVNEKVSCSAPAERLMSTRAFYCLCKATNNNEIRMSFSIFWCPQ